MNIEKQLEEALAEKAALQGQVDEMLAANSEHADEIAAKDQEIAGLVEAHAAALAESASALEDAQAENAELVEKAEEMAAAAEVLTARKVEAEESLAKAQEALKNPAVADAAATGEDTAAHISAADGNEDGAQADESVLATWKALRGKDKMKYYKAHKDEIIEAQRALRDAGKEG
jgi:hypothetical protein